MQLRHLRFFDRILGVILFVLVIPLPLLADLLFKSKRKKIPAKITVLKLHGGGSLLIAMPALLGIKAKYPQATLTLVGTPETKKYAELLGVFNEFVTIDASSPITLLFTGIRALMKAYWQDVFIDLEPHSSLASIFTALTYSGVRIGLVKTGQSYKAKCYTTAIYFNLHAPIHQFYAQIASILEATPASVETCRETLKFRCEGQSVIVYEHPKPALYISAFTSSLSPERMMSATLWIQQWSKTFGEETAFTVVLGGGAGEKAMTNNFAAKIKSMLPRVTIVQTCGTRDLRESMIDINEADEFWGVDSGPLHIARMLGKKCVSFWGPTNPSYLLYPIDGLDETIFYRAFPCSPCVHVSTASPCHGDNQCMKKIFTDETAPPITRF